MCTSQLSSHGEGLTFYFNTLRTDGLQIKSDQKNLYDFTVD